MIAPNHQRSHDEYECYKSSEEDKLGIENYYLHDDPCISTACIAIVLLLCNFELI